MKIKVTSIYVNDQERALRFCTCGNLIQIAALTAGRAE
jgi:hypothetical protein